MSDQEQKSVYEWIGGEKTMLQLVDAFYNRVAKDPELAPLFPADFTEVKRKQFLFLSQYFGGPPLYTEEFGHPMLRARHMRFPITPTRANAWLACMIGAMDEVGLEEGQVREFMLERLTLTARHMTNTPEEG
jgi:hemoglobin